MNDRIKELAKQVGIHFRGHNGSTLDAGPDGIAKFVLYSDMEKFAELIVRECIHVALRDALPTWDNAASEANAQCVKIAADLKEHFRVEE